MSSCKFIEMMSKLRKSSKDSIADLTEFTNFKKYMHIKRSVEVDLKNLLREINASGIKTLVLVCGSAGDGKSHILSYLKNCDEENLLENYIVYNDATESRSVTSNAIETLNENLMSFSDTRIHEDGPNIILAINLGVLSNFIESDYGKNYSLLRQYVDEQALLSSSLNSIECKEKSPFQHISFSDYHMFSLTPNGIGTHYILNIFDKVLGENETNVFYKAYLEASNSCPFSKICPIKHNYEFLQDTIHQRYIAETLVRVMIQDKLIITTRELLNFVYDIIISPKFDFKNISESIIDSEAYLKMYLEMLTPTLLFEGQNVSPLLKCIQNKDPLKNSSEVGDEISINYHVSEDAKAYILKYLDDNVYRNIFLSEGMKELLTNLQQELRSSVFNLLIRSAAIHKGEIEESDFMEFIQFLYAYNTKQTDKLDELFEMVKEAIFQWCGRFGDTEICLEKTNTDYFIYEEIKLEELDVDSNFDIEQFADGSLYRFNTKIVIQYTLSEDDDILSLAVDYELFKLICKLNKGYIQTFDDRNCHADFIAFIDDILKTGNQEREIKIITHDGKIAVIKKMKRGYKFEVK